MKNVLLTFIAIVMYSSMLFGQSLKYPKGVYMSFNEVIERKPSQDTDLIVIKRTKGSIKMSGGNDYKLIKEDKSIKKKIIKKKYIGYSNGDTLFINCFHYKIQPWYTPILSDGKFLVIKGGLSMDPKIQKEQITNNAQMGYMFGAVGGAIQGAQMALLRFIYVIDKKTNKIITVTPEFIQEHLKDMPELLNDFTTEIEPSNQEKLLKYLKIINTNANN
ncbi:MAG: hypothetical protein ACJAUV_000344 [Flavobacteriales bacterium]|jgi:hypothetical protein